MHCSVERMFSLALLLQFAIASPPLIDLLFGAQASQFRLAWERDLVAVSRDRAGFFDAFFKLDYLDLILDTSPSLFDSVRLTEKDVKLVKRTKGYVLPVPSPDRFRSYVDMVWNLGLVQSTFIDWMLYYIILY
jgi:hypothetical protein